MDSRHPYGFRYWPSLNDRRRRSWAYRRDDHECGDIEVLRRRLKGKRSVTPQWNDSLLQSRTGSPALLVNIIGAVDLPSPATAAADSPGSLNVGEYRVIAWVEPGEEYCTQIAVGKNPQWNEQIHIPLIPLSQQAFLHVEIIGEQSPSDPGSSSGTVLVGRTRILLPNEPWTPTSGHHELVRLVGDGHIPEGHINVAMKLVFAEQLSSLY